LREIGFKTDRLDGYLGEEHVCSADINGGEDDLSKTITQTIYLNSQIVATFVRHDISKSSSIEFEGRLRVVIKAGSIYGGTLYRLLNDEGKVVRQFLIPYDADLIEVWPNNVDARRDLNSIQTE
jgi:hypothetical protein